MKAHMKRFIRAPTTSPRKQTLKLVPHLSGDLLAPVVDLLFTNDCAEDKEVRNNEIVETNEDLPPCPRRVSRI